MNFAKLIQGLKQHTKHHSIQGLKILQVLVFAREKCGGVAKKPSRF